MGSTAAARSAVGRLEAGWAAELMVEAVPAAGREVGCWVAVGETVTDLAVAAKVEAATDPAIPEVAARAVELVGVVGSTEAAL